MSEITPFYQKLKSQLIRDHTYLEMVTATRNQLYEFVVFGIKEDVFYKIITPNNRNDVLKCVNLMKQKFSFQVTKRKYVLIFLNKDLETYTKKEIKLNY